VAGRGAEHPAHHHHLRHRGADDDRPGARPRLRQTRDIVITFQLFYEFGFASGGVAYTLNPDHVRGERRTAPNLGSWVATYTTPPVAARWWEGAAVYVAQWVAVRAIQNNGTNVVVSARCAFRR
jgi:hypothetical protein